MRTIAPCMGCTNRTIGCHSSCKSYQEFSRKRQELNDMRRRDGNAKRRTSPSARTKHSGLDNLKHSAQNRRKVDGTDKHSNDS